MLSLVLYLYLFQYLYKSNVTFITIIKSARLLNVSSDPLSRTRGTLTGKSNNNEQITDKEF